MGRAGVIRIGKGWQRRFLFRAYLVLAAGLLAVAAALDAGFSWLHSRLAPADDTWLTTSLALVEAHLVPLPPPERDAAAARLGAAIGIPVEVLAADEVAVMASAPGEVMALEEPGGGVSWLRAFPESGFAVRLGPVERAETSRLLDLVPPAFYLSIFVVVGLWLRPILRDLDLVTRATREFSADYRKPTATAGQVRELDSLARDLDAMSARLSELVQSQKELTAALSHEIRTPLARIRFALAVLDTGSEEERRRQLAAIGADLGEIDGLVASLLEYARLDHPDQHMHRQHIPVEPWIRRTLESSRVPQPEVQVIVEPDAEHAFMDARLMGIALSNLVVNACRHARSTVRVGFSRHGEEHRLVVEDDGEGIAEEHRATVFRAFARLDESRDRSTGGFGLGLAIVARIAALHGGSATVDRAPELGGARFTVAWPGKS
ncbi:MAG TPA: ATP-binding protein [Woeseiaceae bacterium]|nr:ATP-binding protein [Woeseiaceae bacterium]